MNSRFSNAHQDQSNRRGNWEPLSVSVSLAAKPKWLVSKVDISWEGLVGHGRIIKLKENYKTFKFLLKAANIGPNFIDQNQCEARCTCGTDKG